MNTFAKIVFFIFLSFAGHLLLLPFDFVPVAVSFDSETVGISFVSKPLDCFYPESQSLKQISDEMADTVQRKELKSQIDPEETRSDATMPVKEMKPAILQPEAKQKLAPPEIIEKEPVPEKVADEVVLVDSSPMVEETLEEENLDPLPEFRHQPPAPVSVVIESQVGEDLSLSAGTMVRNEVPVSSQSPGSIAGRQDKNNSNQGFINALPRYDVNPPPRYPEVARQRGWQGNVVFEALILESGRVGRLNMLSSSGYRILDKAARKAIKRWKFTPATSFGKSVDSEVEIPFSFSLREL